MKSISSTGASRSTLLATAERSVIVATVAQDLKNPHLINGAQVSILVNWMGIFDPVALFPVNPRQGLSWAKAIPQNVHFANSAIKRLGILPDEVYVTEADANLAKEDPDVGKGFAIGASRKFLLNHIRLGHNSKPIVGDKTLPLEWMIGEAKKKEERTSRCSRRTEKRCRRELIRHGQAKLQGIVPNRVTTGQSNSLGVDLGGGRYGSVHFAVASGSRWRLRRC